LLFEILDNVVREIPVFSEISVRRMRLFSQNSLPASSFLKLNCILSFVSCRFSSL